MTDRKGECRVPADIQARRVQVPWIVPGGDLGGSLVGLGGPPRKVGTGQRPGTTVRLLFTRMAMARIILMVGGREDD